MEVQNYDYKTIVSNNNVTRVDFDPENNLELYCYNECSNTDSSVLKRCRGLVFHDGKLVLSGFPYTDEFTESNQQLRDRLNDFSNWRFFKAYEGTLIRVFYFGNRWFVSTNKKFDAFRSKWSSKLSFGDMFVEGLRRINMLENKKIEDNALMGIFLASLNKDYQYMFLVRNNAENRIVCDAPSSDEHLIFHVGTFMRKENETILNLDDVLQGFSRSSELTFKSVDDVLTYVSNCDCKKTQGIIAFNKNNDQIKIYNSEYHSLYKIRGNVPSIKFRYLSVRMDRNMVNKMYELYPSHIETFENYEKSLCNIATIIHNMYIQRYVKHIHTVVPKEQFIIMQKCHNFYHTNPKKNIVTLKVVINFLNDTPPSILNKMIKDSTTDKNKQDFKHPRSVSNSLNNSPAILPVPHVLSSPVIRPLN